MTTANTQFAKFEMISPDSAYFHHLIATLLNGQMESVMVGLGYLLTAEGHNELYQFDVFQAPTGIAFIYYKRTLLIFIDELK